jgi:NAD(P)-dependent dehydrogenase (short-subunit alcohol dehydrogenase family)
VVLFSSGAAEVGLPNHEAIAASKAAVEGLTRSAAATYAARGLRINAIAPGLVRTNLASKLTSSPQALQASTALHAAGRIGEPDEVARMAAFVLDPSNSWITGSVLRVDGGLSRVRARG